MGIDEKVHVETCACIISSRITSERCRTKY